MHALSIALLIFCMRICDVSIGTVRVIFAIRGKRTIAATLGVLESAIWIVAIAKLTQYLNNPVCIVGWACGFGAGTFIGITLEKWIGSGHILMRVISTEKAWELRNRLLERGVGVTAVPGEGRDGDVLILFVVAPRKRGNELLELIKEIDPEAFITVDPIGHAVGGYLPMPTEASSMRK